MSALITVYTVSHGLRTSEILDALGFCIVSRIVEHVAGAKHVSEEQIVRSWEGWKRTADETIRQALDDRMEKDAVR